MHGITCAAAQVEVRAGTWAVAHVLATVALVQVLGAVPPVPVREIPLSSHIHLIRCLCNSTVTPAPSGTMV